VEREIYEEGEGRERQEEEEEEEDQQKEAIVYLTFIM
jgi:hypothetical protein